MVNILTSYSDLSHVHIDTLETDTHTHTHLDNHRSDNGNSICHTKSSYTSYLTFCTLSDNAVIVASRQQQCCDNLICTYWSEIAVQTAQSRVARTHPLIDMKMMIPMIKRWFACYGRVHNANGFIAFRFIRVCRVESFPVARRTVLVGVRLHRLAGIRRLFL